MAKTVIAEKHPGREQQVLESYPLTHMQEGMLFHALFDGQSGVDVQQLVCTLDERLDVAAFEEAWRRIIARHTALRTSFLWENLGEPVQEVNAHVELPLERHDWRELSFPEQGEHLADYLRKDRRRGFDINEAPLMRLSLFELARDNYKFIWTFHHALLDNRSLHIVLTELFGLYDAVREGGSLPLERPRPFGDYIARLQEQDHSYSEQFWREHLSGFSAPTPLAVARLSGGNANTEVNYGEREVELSPELNAELRSLTQRHALNLHTLALGVWTLLLSRYSGESDVVCGVTKARRPPGLDDGGMMVGLLINTLPARVRVPAHISALDWLKEVEAQQEAAQEHAHTPLVNIQKWSDVPRVRRSSRASSSSKGVH
jgi:hypothetical protein